MSETNEAPALPKLSRRHQRLADYCLEGLTGAAGLRKMQFKGTPLQAADAAYKILKRPEVKAYMAKRRQDLSDATQIRIEQVLRELSLVGFGNIKALFNEKGGLRPVTDLTDDEAAMIASVEVEDLFEGRGESRERIGTLHKVRAWNKVESLEKIAKILGAMKDRVEHSGEVKTTGGVLIVPAAPTEEAWMKIAEQQQSALTEKERSFNVNATSS